MEKKEAGYLIRTKAGNYGRTKHCEQKVNGKYVLFLETEAGVPILDQNGKQKKILVACDNAIIRGYVN